MATFPRRDPDGPTTEPAADPPPAPANDPGGAHTKGYSADPTPGPNAADLKDPIPLADAPEGAEIIQPERAGRVRPTGRDEPGEYTPNDRLMGSDR